MASPYRFDETLQQTVCEVCGVAVLPSRLRDHLRTVKSHGETPSAVRNGWAKEQTDRKAGDPREAASQPDGRDEIDGLETVECFRCGDCESRFASRKTLRRHRTAEHEVRETAGRPRKSKAPSSSGHDRLWMQSVFGPSSPHHRYFLVRRRPANLLGDDGSDRAARAVGSEGEETTGELAHARVSEMFHRAATQKEGDRSRAKIESNARETLTPWMNVTGWPKRLNGLDLRGLVEASALPGRESTTENDPLSVICASVRTVFDGATVELNGLSRDLRQWWRSPKPDAFSYRPFENLRSTAAFGRYVSYWQRLIVYYCRLHDLTETERESGHRVRFDVETDELLGYIKSLARDRVRRTSTTEDRIRKGEELLKGDVTTLMTVTLKRKFLDDGWDNLLVHFTAVLGIDERTLRLKEPEDYTNILAGLIYCSRLVMLQDCLRLIRASDRFRDSSELDRVELTVECVQEYRRTYLTNGSYTPVSLMLNNLAYGLKRAALVPGRAHVLWVDPDTKTELKFEGRSITRDGLRNMIRELLAEANRSIWRDLLFVEDDGARFSVELTSVDDNMALGARATSGAFLNLDGAAEVAAGSKLVLDNIYRGEKAREEMLRSSRAGSAEDASRPPFKDSGLKRYRKSVEKFLDALFVLVHVTGGAPARGSEISCVRYRDGVSVDRNLFVIGGRVVFISQYHKNLVVTDRLKVIPRVLPKSVSDLVVLYLRYVRSFTDVLDGIYDVSKPETDYLWETRGGDCWNNNRMTRAMAEASERHLGVKLTVRSYRHVAVAFSRDVVHSDRPTVERFRDFVNEDSILDESEDEVGELDGDAVGDLEREQMVAALQTGHALRTRLNHYGQAVNLTAKLTSNSLELFTRVSEAWHRFLGVADEGENKGGRKHRRQESSISLPIDRTPGSTVIPAMKRQRSKTNLGEEISTQNFGARFERKPRDLEREAYGLLKDKFGHADFKSREQLEGVLSVLDARPLTVVVLPTGGGKSLLWMLPAHVDERGTTAVVVPYVSLAADLLERCSEIGLEAALWTPDSQPSDCKVVIVTTDHAAGSAFLDLPCEQTFLMYLSILKANGSLNRIVIDECHTVVTENGYRRAMGQVFQLRSLEVPMLLTTATLPPRIIDDFEEVMALADSAVRYIRRQSLRPNISVSVEKCDNGRALTVAAELARKAREDLQPGCKIVLYVRWKNQMSVLAGPKMLDCQVYHGDMTDDERRRSLEEWQKPGQTFLIATTAFGCGIDHPGIALVIHVNRPYNMINYVQESGRAGRRFEKARSIIVLESRETASPQTTDGVALADLRFEDYNKKILELMISSTECRLLTITRFLNGGSGDDCAGLSANPCDNCRTEDVSRREGEPIEGKRAVQARVKSVRKDLDRILETIDWLRSDCAACLLANSENERGPRHRFSQCDRTPGLGFEEIVNFSRSIKWPKNFGYCWTCGMPEEICEEIKKKKEDRGACKYKWLIVTVAAFGRLENGFGIRTKAFIGISDWKGFDYAGWLGGKSDKTLHNIRSTNAFALFDLFSTTYLRKDLRTSKVTRRKPTEMT